MSQALVIERGDSFPLYEWYLPVLRDQTRKTPFVSGAAAGEAGGSTTRGIAAGVTATLPLPPAGS